MNKILALIFSVSLSIPISPLPTVSNAYGQNQTGTAPDFFVEISGKYTHPRSGYELEIPDGWSGVDFLGIVILAEGNYTDPNNKLEGSMMIFALPRSSFNTTFWSQENLERGIQKSDRNCNLVSYTYTRVNDLEGIHLIDECEESDPAKMAMYGFMTREHFVALFFFGGLPGDYEKHVDAFEQTVRTLKLKDAVPFKSAMADTFNLTNEKYQVTAKDIPVEVSVDTNSEISDFNFSDSAKRITFKVEGEEGTIGLTIIDIDSVLEGPYTVTIDGNATTEFVLAEDELNGQTTMEIAYSHSKHDVAIIGTNVVPEFPLPLAVTIASIMAIVVLFGRSSLIKPMT